MIYERWIRLVVLVESIASRDSSDNLEDNVPIIFACQAEISSLTAV